MASHITIVFSYYIYISLKKTPELKHFTAICPRRMDVGTDGQKFVISFNAQLGGWYYGNKHR